MGSLQRYKRALSLPMMTRYEHICTLYFQSTFCQDRTRWRPIIHLLSLFNLLIIIPPAPRVLRSASLMRVTLNCSLSYISIQPFGGIDSAGPYPVMNYANALPPTNSTGYNNPSHLTTVSVCLRSHASFVDGGFVEGPCDCPWSTPRAVCSGNPCVCSPVPAAPSVLSSRAHAAFLTAPLTVGGTQRPPSRSRSSS
jgi:hypothetical protein